MAAVIEFPGTAQERWDEDSDLGESNAKPDVAEPDADEELDDADEELDDAGESDAEPSELDSDEEFPDGEERYYDVSDGDEEEAEPVEPVDQNAVPPPAPTPQNPTRKATWADLAGDEKDEIRRRVFDFGDHVGFVHHGGYLRGMVGTMVMHRPTGTGMVLLANAEVRGLNELVLDFAELYNQHYPASSLQLVRR